MVKQFSTCLQVTYGGTDNDVSANYNDLLYEKLSPAKFGFLGFS